MAEWLKAMLLKSITIVRWSGVQIPLPPQMKIRYTKHAKDMLSQRKIEKDLVERTVENPDFKTKGKYEREIYLKGFKKNYLKIIAIKKRKELYITTLYWINPERVRKGGAL